MIKILVVEDDKVLSGSIRDIMREIGEVTQIYDGEEALYEASSGLFDLIILDLMLPSMNGYEILAELREQKIETPVLILTAKDGIDDKVQGFKEGADDYLTKPFHREELLMRSRALLKRSLGLLDENVIKVGPLECHILNRSFEYKGQEITLQGKEFEILQYLMQNKKMIVTKEQIFDRIWGFDSNTSLTVVEVYMSNLRKHLKPYGLDTWVKTIRNVGYMLEEQDA